FAFFLASSARPHVRPPFPTRRSSDLLVVVADQPRMQVVGYVVDLTCPATPAAVDGPAGLHHVAPLVEFLEPPLLTNRVEADAAKDRKSTRLNSSHVTSSYAAFCLKKK